MRARACVCLSVCHVHTYKLVYALKYVHTDSYVSAYTHLLILYVSAHTHLLILCAQVCTHRLMELIRWICAPNAVLQPIELGDCVGGGAGGGGGGGGTARVYINGNGQEETSKNREG